MGNRPVISAVPTISTIIADNKDDINTVIANGSELSSRALTLVDGIDSVVTSVEDLLDEVKNGQGSISMLLEDDTLYHQLRGSLNDIDDLISEVQDDGLKLRVKLGFKKRSKDKK